MDFPPPHMVWYEALNDKSMEAIWMETKRLHPEAEYTEISAAQTNSIDEFADWFDQWTTRLSAARVRILLVWHAHCLSASCQQMLRRSMEKRSFKCRVWFHIEEPASLQPAILSRCIVRVLRPAIGHQFERSGTIPPTWRACWDNPLGFEMELCPVK